jgi:hypothetical protein
MRTSVAAAALVLSVLACTESHDPSQSALRPDLAVASIQCIGVPAPVIDGWPGDVNYPEPRVFLESQGWWGKRRADGTVPTYGEAEHIHVGLCFPLQKTVSGNTRFRVRVQGHNLPPGSLIESTLLHDGTGTSFGRLVWNHTVQAGQTDVDLWREVTVSTTGSPNGIREFRNLTKVIRPAEANGSAELHASSGWCWTINNSGTTTSGNSTLCEPGTAQPTMGRGWYSCFEYKIGELRNFSYPYGGRSPNTNYIIRYSGRDGAGDNNLVSGHIVRLDPQFHTGGLGTLIDSAGGAVTNKEDTIYAAQMKTGIRRIVVIGFANANCTSGAGAVPQDGIVSGVISIPIKVN